VLNIFVRNADSGGHKMGEVIMKIKVMPEDASIDMEKLKEEIMKSIPDYAKVNKTEIAPIAFGLKALMLYITMPDQSPDELMDKIAGIEGVGNATIDELSLI